MLSTLRQRNFALLWVSSLISLIGDRALSERADEVAEPAVRMADVEVFGETAEEADPGV